MKKLLTLLLLPPLTFAQMENIIDAQCRDMWGSSSKDIVKCIETWKNSNQWSDVHVPEGAEPNPDLPYNKVIKPIPIDSDLSFSIPQPKAEICPDWRADGNNFLRNSCETRNSTKFKKWWRQEIVGYMFKQNNDSSNWLHIQKGGVLSGWLPITDDSERGIDMNGAWELKYADANIARFTFYAGQSQCTYAISKKGKLYWFAQSSANYSNICPSLLTTRNKVKTLSELKKELSEKNG